MGGLHQVLAGGAALQAGHQFLEDFLVLVVGGQAGANQVAFPFFAVGILGRSGVVGAVAELGGFCLAQLAFEGLRIERAFDTAFDKAVFGFLLGDVAGGFIGNKVTAGQEQEAEDEQGGFGGHKVLSGSLQKGYSWPLEKRSIQVVMAAWILASSSLLFWFRP